MLSHLQNSIFHSRYFVDCILYFDTRFLTILCCPELLNLFSYKLYTSLLKTWYELKKYMTKKL